MVTNAINWPEYFTEILKNNNGKSFQVQKILISDFFINQDIPNELVFSDCTFSNHALLENCKIRKGIHFNNCHFKNGIRITGRDTQINTLQFSNCFGNIDLYEGNFNSASITPGKENTLNIKGGFYKILFISNGGNNFFDRIDLDCSDTSGKIIFSNVSVKKFNLGGYCENLAIKFKVLFFDNLKINNFHSEKGATFTFLNPLTTKSSICIEDSNLGQSSFSHTQLDQFNIEIKNSEISNCKFNFIKWNYNINSELIINAPKNVSHASFTSSRAEILLETKDIYRQFKYSLEKKHDYISAQIMHEIEMNLYAKSLGNSLKVLPEKLILTLSRITSKYGQSISRPLLCLILVNPLVFLLILCGKPDFIQDTYITTQFNYEELKSGMMNGLVWILKLSNPFEKLEINIGGFILIVYALRIWTSYAIYNFIRASRRFLK